MNAQRLYVMFTPVRPATPPIHIISSTPSTTYCTDASPSSRK